MNDVDELLARTMEDYASQIDGVDVGPGLSRRIRQQNRRRAVGSVVAGCAAVAAVGWGASLVWTEPHAVVAPPASTGEPALVSTGRCAGLVVLVGSPAPGAPSSDEGVSLPADAVAVTTAGVDVTMGGQDYLWLRAMGPCHEEVVVEAQGPLVQSGTHGKPTPFTAVGPASSIATLFTNTTVDGTETFTVGLADSCGLEVCHPLAAVDVTVDADRPGPSGAEPTARPTP